MSEICHRCQEIIEPLTGTCFPCYGTAIDAAVLAERRAIRDWLDKLANEDPIPDQLLDAETVLSEFRKGGRFDCEGEG